MRTHPYLCLAILSLSTYSAATATPVYEQLYGGPGSANATDQLFVAAGNTAFESYGFEVSFNSTSDARINALNASNAFVFNAAGVNTPTWVSSRRYTFSNSYSGDLTKLVNISVTDTFSNITYNIPQYNISFGNIRSLVVRMVAPDTDLTGSTPRPTAGSLDFANWTLQGQSIAGMPSLLSNSTTNTAADDIRLINYFSVTGIDFTQPWTLTGDFTMTWSGSTLPGTNPNPLPNNNDLAFQIKGYQLDLTETPEPQTILLLGPALLALGLRSRRR